MQRKFISIIGILAVLILVVVVLSGYNSTAQNKTYSANGLNLTYPGDMKPNATFIYVSSPNSKAKIDTLGNDKLVISMAYMPMNLTGLSSYITFDQFKSLAYESLTKDNDTKMTQLYSGDKSKNGTAIFEVIYSSKDPVSGTELKNKKEVLFNNLDHIHIVIFQTKAVDFESQQETINKIINSIIIT